MIPAKPILRWAGGKSWLASKVVDVLGAGGEGRVYVEPFAGSLAVLFERYNRRGGVPEPCIVSDVLPDVGNLYAAIARHPNDFLDAFEAIPRSDWFESYFERRDRFNALPVPEAARGPDAERAALFVWLNRTGFNGVCRFSRKGVFNVPRGSFGKSGPSFPTVDEIRAVAHALSRAFVPIGLDFERVPAPPGSDVYLDPPYLPKGGDFTGYHGDGFNLAAHYRLGAWAKSLVERGCRVVVSNHDVDVIPDLYPPEVFEVVGRPKRKNAVSAGARVATGEILLRSRSREIRARNDSSPVTVDG